MNIKIIIFLCFTFSLYSTPSSVYSHYNYHCIKNACLALIKEYGDACTCKHSADQVLSYIVRLNSTIANKVLKDLINEGKIPKNYASKLHN